MRGAMPLRSVHQPHTLHRPHSPGDEKQRSQLSYDSRRAMRYGHYGVVFRLHHPLRTSQFTRIVVGGLAVRKKMNTQLSLSSSNTLTYVWMCFLLIHMFLSITLHTTTLWLAVAMAFIRRMTLRAATLNRLGQIANYQK